MPIRRVDANLWQPSWQQLDNGVPHEFVIELGPSV
jgi:hypothetical protein